MKVKCSSSFNPETVSGIQISIKGAPDVVYVATQGSNKQQLLQEFNKEFGQRIADGKFFRVVLTTHSAPHGEFRMETSVGIDGFKSDVKTLKNLFLVTAIKAA